MTPPPTTNNVIDVYSGNNTIIIITRNRICIKYLCADIMILLLSSSSLFTHTRRYNIIIAQTHDMNIRESHLCVRLCAHVVWQNFVVQCDSNRRYLRVVTGYNLRIIYFIYYIVYTRLQERRTRVALV